MNNDTTVSDTLESKKLEEIDWDKPSDNRKFEKSENTVVLILALSTFPSRKDEKDKKYKKYLSNNKYQYVSNHDETISCSGRYQLEPVPKILSERLAAENPAAGIDKVIMLCTKATQKPETVTIFDEDEKAIYKIEDVSADDYFKHSVKNWLKPNISDEDQFKIIIVDEEKPQEAVQNVVDILRDIPHLRLFMDNHGGFRSVSVVMEAIVSLLGYELEKKAEFYTVFYKGQNSKVTLDSSVEMFDFASGINEFLNFGRTKSLNEYLLKKGYQDDALLNYIQTISDGILLCDMDSFNSGLKGISGYIDSDATQQEDQYLSIFKSTIKKDYGKLLEEHTVFDEIAWCLKKELYQQALTLVESRVPESIVGGKYFRVNWNKIIYASRYENNSWTKTNLKNNLEDIINKAKKDWELKENYLLEQWAYSYVVPGSWDNKEYAELDGNWLAKDESTGWKEKSVRENSRSLYVKNKESENNDIYSYRININQSSLKEEQKKTFYIFMDLHMALKNQRNQANHSANGDRISVEKIDDALKGYLQLAEELGLYGTIGSDFQQVNADSNHLTQHIPIPEGWNFEE